MKRGRPATANLPCPFPDCFHCPHPDCIKEFIFEKGRRRGRSMRDKDPETEARVLARSILGTEKEGGRSR